MRHHPIGASAAGKSGPPTDQTTAPITDRITASTTARQLGKTAVKSRAELLPIGELETEFYLRLTAVDKPGVLAKVTAILGEEGISIRALVQKPEHDPENVPVIFLTHSTKDSKVAKALKRIDALDIIRAPTQVLRFYR